MNWGEKGYADSPEAVLVQSWTDEELKAFLRRMTGKEYTKPLRGSRENAGRRGSLNRVAIRELCKLVGREESNTTYNGRQEKLYGETA